MIVYNDISHVDNRNKNVVFNYIKNIRKSGDKRPLRILDVGGGSNNWLSPHTTHVIDNYWYEDLDNIKLFNFDLEDASAWEVVFRDVEENGKFDFVSCTHTLEDLNDPQFTCKSINLIGNAGYVAVPSKYAEFAKFETCYGGPPYKGYHHHRWIYTIEDDIFVGYPKQGLLEHLALDELLGGDPDMIIAQHTEISFLWEGDFEFDFIQPWSMLRDMPPRNQPMLNVLLGKNELSWDKLVQNTKERQNNG